MPLYELFQISNDKNRGVYEYPDELSFRKFAMLFPDWRNLLYNEITEAEANEIRRLVRGKIKRRVEKLMFDLWGRPLLEE